MEITARAHAQWIGDPAFAAIRKRDIRHKEMEPPSNRQPHPEALLNHHLLLRKTFDCGEQVPAQTILSISADDYCKVYINGRYVVEGPSQGYPERYYRQDLEISDFLQPGLNLIAVHLYYHGKFTRAFSSGDFRQGLWVSLQADDRTLLISDTSWRIRHAIEYADKTTFGYDTQYHEHIDSRLQQAKWREPGFDDSAWGYAVVQSEMEEVRLIAQPTPPVSLSQLKPTSVHTDQQGHIHLDFGAEIVGMLEMKASGISGQVVEIRCGEERFEDGTVRYQMRCNCDYRDLWTLSGAGDDTLAWFDYKAFRYVELIAPPGVQIDRDSIAATVRHYPVDDAMGVMQSESKLLEQIWHICRQGVVYGTQDHYTDCPSREKGGYLGDNTIIAQSHFYVSGDLRIFRKMLEDFAATSSICPGLMAVTPGSFMQEIADYSLQWPLQVLIYYKHSGDKEFVRRMLPIARGMIAHFSGFCGEDGLLREVRDKWNLVDWPYTFLDGYDFPLTKPVGPGCHNVLNAFYRDALASTNALAEIVDDTDERYDVAAFDAAFCKAFWDESAGLFRDAIGSSHHALHANMLPLAFGIVPAEHRASVLAFLKEKRVSCGVYMAYFYLQALAAAGDYNGIWDMITTEERHEYPAMDPQNPDAVKVSYGYWANMVREGATTCFEAWSKELKNNTSLCHPWASAPIPLLVEEILGIQPANPGWVGGIALNPHLPADMPDLRLTLSLPCGQVTVEVQDGQVSVTPL